MLSSKINETDNDKTTNFININKLVTSIEFAISNLIYQKTIDSKEHLNIPNIEKLTEFLKFIGNIKELDKVETFEFLLKTMNDYDFLFNEANGTKKIIPDLINSLREYAIINKENNSIEIDVASVLSHIIEKHQKDKSHRFYATVGLNHFFDFNGEQYNAASEKIGYRFKIKNYNRNHNNLLHKVKEKRLISEIYGMIYVSGILYKIAKTTDARFNSTNIGFATGVSFFNALDFNISIAVPTTTIKDTFIGFSFDIPLSEYLKRL